LKQKVTGKEAETGKIDIDLMMTGRPRSLRDKMRVNLDAVREAEEEKTVASLEDVTERLEGNREGDPPTEEGKARIKPGRVLVYFPRPLIIKGLTLASSRGVFSMCRGDNIIFSISFSKL